MACKYWLRLCCALITGLVIEAQDSRFIEPTAGSWKTWVLASGGDLRLNPPRAADTSTEVVWLKNFIAETRRSPISLQQLRYWTAGSPSYRWMEIILRQIETKPLSNPRNTRLLALMTVAVYDSTIAAWDSKYAYRRPRPSEFDPSVPVMEPPPRSPSYPSELAATAGAASEILAYGWPADADVFRSLADEAARASLMAGWNHPSDVIAGLQLGRTVAAKVVQWADNDGSQIVWTGTAPMGPGLWNGSNPNEPLMGTWKTWVLTSGRQLRPAPPFGHDSPEKKAELEEIRNYPRSFNSNQRALFYQTLEGIFGYWYQNLSQRLFESKLDSNPPRAARAYALAAIAQYDSLVACWDGKYAYWAIRPFQLDSSVVTLFPTPNHPSYPAAHGCSSSALARVIARLFPDFDVVIESKAEEAAESRVGSGIHYRSDIETGRTIGSKVGDLVIERASGDGSR